MSPNFRLQLLVLFPLLLTGCSLSTTAPPTPLPEKGRTIQGRVLGGQQPIVGAHVYLLAANTTGYGGNGITASASNASVSLLGGTGNSDSIGSYVLSDSGGSFSINGDYSCTPNTQVYLYALGGDPGAGANSAAGLLAVLGNCPVSGSFSSSLFVSMNEVTTIAAAYAMAGFATDATHVSNSGTTLANSGIADAFANAAQLVNITSGAALTTTPEGNGTVPQSEIDTLADILAACVNSTGPGSPACTTLLGDELSGGTTGTAPTETATAAINMAHNPGANIPALYALSTSSPPFEPVLGIQPNDFAIALKFTGGGIGSSGPNAIAIDGSQNVWVLSTAANTLSEFTNAGVALSGSSGYTGGGLQSPEGLAIDLSGNVWVANNAGSVSKFSSTGTAISSPPGYLVAGLNGAGPAAVAVDGSGNVWVADDTSYMPHVSELNSSGGAVSPSSGYTGGGVINAVSVAIDGSGNAWFADDSNFAGVSKFSSGGTPSPLTSSNSGGGIAFPGPFAVAIDASGNVWAACSTALAKLSSSGTAISPSTGYTGGGIALPKGIAIDGGGNVWIANYNNNSVSEFSNGGTALTPSTGYTAAGVLSGPYGVAIDSSGNVWVANDVSQSVDELLGIAMPVITPLVTGVKNNTIATAP